MMTLNGRGLLLAALTFPSWSAGASASAESSGVPAQGSVEHWDETTDAGTLRWSAYGGQRYLNEARR